MFRALVVGTYYLLASMWLSFWPALIAGLLVHLIAPDWEVIAFGAVFSYVLVELIFRYKGNWRG